MTPPLPPQLLSKGLVGHGLAQRRMAIRGTVCQTRMRRRVLQGEALKRELKWDNLPQNKFCASPMSFCPF